MKQARILLSAIAVFALVGGAFAFKALNFNAFPAYTYTTSYSTLGTLYTTAVPVCLPINPLRFITTAGTVPTTVYSTLGTTTTTPVTLRQANGATITFPAFTCTSIPNTFTTITF